MGQRGPAPKPSAIEAAEGNPGHRKRNDAEPRPPVGEPKMPRGLSTAARRIWREAVAILQATPGLLTHAEADILANYCRTQAQIQTLEAARQAELERRLAEHPQGPNSHLSKEEVEAEILERYEKRLAYLTRLATQLNDRLGLNASARSRMNIDAPPPPPPRDPVAGALFGQPSVGPQLVKV